MPTSDREQVYDVKTVSIDLLALTAALLWICAILVLSMFSNNTSALTWFGRGMLGAISVYVGAFLLVHIIATRRLASPDESSSEAKEIAEDLEPEPEADTIENSEQKETLEKNVTE
jgi:Na+/melibiose symporter-like transporter